jgi:hypothetical protein
MGTASNAATIPGSSNPQEATIAIPFESKRDFLVVVEGTIGGLDPRGVQEARLEVPPGS